MNWISPKSPYDLLQEKVFSDQRQLLAACIFCNQTRRCVVEPLFWNFLDLNPTPSQAAQAILDHLKQLLQPLGLQSRSAKTLTRFFADYLNKSWTSPSELYGIGQYAESAWLIFCQGQWRDIPRPKDHTLAWYYDWLHDTNGEVNSEQS